MGETTGFTLDPNSLSPGFVITFANDCAVSVRFGVGNYCANRSFDITAASFGRSIDSKLSCPNAEVAIITADGSVMEPHAAVLPDALPRVFELVAAGHLDAAQDALIEAGGDA